MNTIIRVAVWIVLFTVSSISAAETSLLRFSRLVDGTGEVLEAREVAVQDGIIVAVGNELQHRYPAATRHDLDDLVALPGLIDVHVHVTYGLAEPSHGSAWADLFASPAEERMVEATRNARRTLATGVTSARDLFAFDGLAYQLRALIDNDIIPGPRLFVAGEGIHPLTLAELPEGEQRDIVAEFRELARQRVESGADWVKIFATTGSADDLSGRQVFSFPEIKAATDVAHAAGLRVAVHCYGPAAVDDALRAGVDSIEHAVDLDDELLQLWASTDTVYVPTIDHNRYYAEHRDEYGYDEDTERKLREFIERNVMALRRAHDAGIRVAMGSDAVMTMFGQNTHELEWFVLAGMTTAEAIQAATVNGAELLGQADTLGRLRVGYAADIVAVEGDPLLDIGALTRGVRWVMKGGRVMLAREVGPSRSSD